MFESSTQPMHGSISKSAGIDINPVIYAHGFREKDINLFSTTPLSSANIKAFVQANESFYLE